MAAPLCAQSVKAGIDAWQRADYPAAIAIWRPLAEGGDADAQFNLGQAYRLGRGVPLDLAAAKIWFERAARSGHLDAETTLGLLVFQNGDRAEGLKWLKQAADQGEPRALLVIGTALFNGDGVAQDRVLGYAYVSRSAAQGLAPAQDTLAQLDQLMPLADRQKGIALARSIPSGSPVAATAKRVRTAQAKPNISKPATAKPSVTKPAPPAAARPAPIADASGGWRIQLGAFSQRATAEALYQRLSGKPVLAGRGPYYVAAGSITRLQVGPFASKAAAASACVAVGGACFPVPGK
ncbi:SPOR domain-containing protein [Sphingomonas sp.]|uniref:SPOR domain-containing protein n=1 Tax=Sphingomonas sp. TaxID=28214 RepID=UPI00389E91E8